MCIKKVYWSYTLLKTPNQQFVSHFFQLGDNEIRFVLDQHDSLDICSAIPLKQ